MFNSRTVILLGLSLILAAGAAWVANNWVQMQQTPSQIAVEESGEKVVIAALHLPYGQKIERKHLKTISLPKEAVPSGTFSDPALLEGMIVTQELLEGDVLRAERVSDHIEGATLAALIEPKMRAFTIRVNDVVGVAGFLLPGNRIDVISTRKKNKAGRSTSETILKDVKVLAVDQTAKTNKNDPVIVRAVTMELTPKQAEKLSSYRNDGQIQLTLRNPLDNFIAAAPKKKVYRKRVAKPVEEAPPEVIIIKGTTWEKKKLPI